MNGEDSSILGEVLSDGQMDGWIEVRCASYLSSAFVRSGCGLASSVLCSLWYSLSAEGTGSNSAVSLLVPQCRLNFHHLLWIWRPLLSHAAELRPERR